MFISHLVAYLPCSRATFYNNELDKLDSIKEAINKNKVSRKCKMINLWTEPDSAPALQIAGFKLIGDDDEVHRLNGSRQEHKVTGDLNVATKLSEEAKKKIDAILDEEY